MNKLALTAAVLAGAAAGGVGATALTVQASTPVEHRVVVSAQVPVGTPALTKIWKKVDTMLCDKAEAKAGLPADTCAVEQGTVVSITRGELNDSVVASFRFDGTWVKSNR